MANDSGLRAELRKVKGWKPTALANAVRRLANQHNIAPRLDALYTLAVLNDLNLHDYGVDSDSQRRASDLARQIVATSEAPEVQTRRNRGSPTPVALKRVVQVEAGAADLGAVPSFLSEYLTGASHKRSAAAYRLFYLIENSARVVIRRVLENEHGANEWWTKGVDPKIQKAAEGRRKQDEGDPWHEPRGEHDIQYIDLHHYAAIITSSSNWPLFEPIFKYETFVTESLRQINVSRRVVAHMNGLQSDDYDHLKSQSRKWMKTLRKAEDEGRIP